MIARRIAASCAALLVAACVENRVGKGGKSSETVALVSGKVVDSNGDGVKGAWVALVPDAYNPVPAAALPSERFSP